MAGMLDDLLENLGPNPGAASIDQPCQPYLYDSSCICIPEFPLMTAIAPAGHLVQKCNHKSDSGKN